MFRIGCPGHREEWALQARGRPRENLRQQNSPNHPTTNSQGTAAVEDLAPQLIHILKMVSFVDCESCSERVTGGEDYKRRRMNDESPPSESFTSAQRQQTARQRKQKLMSKFSDSGFEEDLRSSPISSPGCIGVQAVDVRLSSWYLQYGDIGYKIQVEKEAQYHPCKSLARQPQVGNSRLCTAVIEWTANLNRFTVKRLNSCKKILNTY